MRKQDSPVVQVNEEVFCSTPDIQNGCTSHRWKVVWEGKAKAFSANKYVSNGFPLQALDETLTNGFNLRKFGQIQASGE